MQLLFVRGRGVSGRCFVTDGDAGDENRIDVIHAGIVHDDSVSPAGGGLALKFILPGAAGVISEAGVLVGAIGRDTVDDVERLFWRAEKDSDVGGGVQLAGVVIRGLATNKKSQDEGQAETVWKERFHSRNT
jgi:hypothetical protein